MHWIFSYIICNGRTINFFALKKYRLFIANKFKIIYNDHRKYISNFNLYCRIYLQVTIVFVSETSYDQPIKANNYFSL